MKQPLKSASRDHFERQRLSDEQYKKFEALLNHQPSSKKGNYKQASIAAMFALSACIMLALVIWPNNMTWLQSQNTLTYEQYINSIAQEVVMNHIKMKPLEFTGNTVASLRGQFTDLDFSLVQSHFFSQNQAKTNMQGGRYCSIQGVTAAQLRYKTTDSAHATLYQVPFDEKKFGEIPNLNLDQAPIQLTVKGLTINMWVERDVLMVSVLPI